MRVLVCFYVYLSFYLSVHEYNLFLTSQHGDRHFQNNFHRCFKIKMRTFGKRDRTKFMRSSKETGGLADQLPDLLREIRQRKKINSCVR